MKAEAEKRGLGSCVELKFCRLEKGKDGSKAFAINTQEQWDEERPLLSGNTSSLQGRNLFTSYKTTSRTILKDTGRLFYRLISNQG